MNLTVAHVGDSGGDNDGRYTQIAFEWLHDHLPGLVNNVKLDNDYIDLNNRRDFLAENKKYDIVIIKYVFDAPTKLGDHHKGFFGVSEHHSSKNWRYRILRSNAKVVFAFGGDTEISGFVLGDINGYKRYKISSGTIYVRSDIVPKVNNL